MCVCVCLCVSVCLCVCVCVLASGFAGRRACLVALLLLHHDGGGVLLGAKPSAPLDAQLLVQLGGRRLPGDVGRCGEMWGGLGRYGELGAARRPSPATPPPRARGWTHRARGRPPGRRPPLRPYCRAPGPGLARARLGRHIVCRWRARDERRPERVVRVPLDRVACDRVAVCVPAGTAASRPQPGPTTRLPELVRVRVRATVRVRARVRARVRVRVQVLVRFRFRFRVRVGLRLRELGGLCVDAVLQSAHLVRVRVRVRARARVWVRVRSCRAPTSPHSACSASLRWRAVP